MAVPFTVDWPGAPVSGEMTGADPAPAPAPAPAPPADVSLSVSKTAPPEARAPRDDAVVGPGSPPVDRADLARRALLGLIGPEASASRFGAMESEAGAIADTYGAQMDALHPLLTRRMAASERALSAIQDYRDELGKSQPTPPTLTKPPAVPDLKVRPWLDPEGKNALSVIAQSLGMLATGIGGLAIGAPKTALSQFREAAENWRRDEKDRAESNWQDFQATIEQMRAENTQALQMYDIAERQYGANILAKQASMIAETKAVGLEDANIMAMSMPYELARQGHEAILRTTAVIQEQATRMAAVFQRWDKATADVPASPWRATAQIHTLESAMKTERDPEKRSEMQNRVDTLKASVQQYNDDQTKQRIAAAGATLTEKMLPAWVQSTQTVDRFQRRLGSLHAAYKVLDREGLLRGGPAAVSEIPAWIQRANPAAWEKKDVQEALGVINTFFAPQTVGFDRTMLDDKGARFQQAYGTALHNPLMPYREFLGIAKVWTEESDQVKRYLGLQGKWLETMGKGGGLSVPDLSGAGEE
jgi:hypothetical protein